MSIDIQPESHALERRVRRPSAASPPSSPKPAKRRAWWKRGLAGLGVLGVLAAGGFALVSSVAPENDLDMLTHAIKRGDLLVSVTEEGTLESSSNKEIKCKVKGGSTVLWVIESGTEVAPGDELVRLDTSTIEDNISQQTIAYQTALSTYAQSQSDVAVAEISVTEYLEGTFRSEVKTAESNVAIAEENLRVAQNVLDHSRKMFRKGYISKLEMDGNEYAVEHARLELDVMRTTLEVLEKFTKPKMLEELRSTLKSARAKLASDKASLDLEKARLDREKQQLENCIIRAETGGLVIYPSAAEWKREPDIEEGAAVREDQVLLIMPDLDEMQVKIGVHEAKVDRIQPGTRARVQLQETTLDGRVQSVASIAKPAGWWTGNVVKYDTIIKVDPRPGLKPGMSAIVELILAEHNNVLTIPVAAVVEQADGFYCWVKEGVRTRRRRLQLGDSNDQFIVVDGGLKEGDVVVLDPLAYIEQARDEALKPIDPQPSDSGSRPAETGATSQSENGSDNARKKQRDQDAVKKSGAATREGKAAGAKRKSTSAAK